MAEDGVTNSARKYVIVFLALITLIFVGLRWHGKTSQPAALPNGMQPRSRAVEAYLPEDETDDARNGAFMPPLAAAPPVAPAPEPRTKLLPVATTLQSEATAKALSSKARTQSTPTVLTKGNLPTTSTAAVSSTSTTSTTTTTTTMAWPRSVGTFPAMQVQLPKLAEQQRRGVER